MFFWALTIRSRSEGTSIQAVFADWQAALGSAMQHHDIVERITDSHEDFPTSGRAEYIEVCRAHIHGEVKDVPPNDAPFQHAFIDYDGNVSYTNEPEAGGLIAEKHRVSFTEHERIQLLEKSVPLEQII